MKYIPQGPPFQMIDSLVQTNNGHTETSFLITNDNVLVENGQFTTAGLIENMAQTAAAGVGYESQLIGQKPPVGFIGAVKNFQVAQLPAVGSVLKTIIEPQHVIGNVQMVMGKVFLNDTLIASAEYKIFLEQA